MIVLYPHQEKFVSEIREALKTHKSVLAQAPCGFGKTVIASYIAHQVTAKSKRIYFLCHRRELLTQTANTFDKEGINYGIVAPGYSEKHSSVQIATMQTLLRRLSNHRGDLVFIDEAHMSRAKGWSAIIQHFKATGAWIIGLTASPIRLDGKGLGEHFQTMVQGPSTAWMIENGFLSSYRYYAPSVPNLRNVHKRMGDYVSSELEQAMNRPTIVGNAITHWRKYANGKRTVVYCVSISHSQQTAEAFRSAGISAVHVDGESSDSERMEAIGGFADGKYLIITNCALWTEGLDISSCVGREVPIECVILLRPTQSTALAVQMHGRGLRRKDIPAIFLDHANIVQTHGLPDQERNWVLEGLSENGGSAKQSTMVKICPNCFAAQKSGSPTCKFCGAIFPLKPREVHQIEGDLEEVTMRSAPVERVMQEDKQYQFLVQLGKRRGYKNPVGWASYVWKARERKRLSHVH